MHSYYVPFLYLLGTYRVDLKICIILLLLFVLHYHLEATTEIRVPFMLAAA